MIIPLTDSLIRESFDKTGLAENYYSLFSKEAYRCYESLQKDMPDDNETTESDSNAIESLRQTSVYLKCYVTEINKGHCEKWAKSFARSFTHDNESLYHSVWNSINALENQEEGYSELEIHVNNISGEQLFRDRYKYLLIERCKKAYELAEKYTQIYKNCISEGKSHYYAHAYASINEDTESFDYLDEIHAEAYEAACKHGIDDKEAYNFALSCTGADLDGYYASLEGFIRCYPKDWQKEYYITLMCKHHKRNYNEEISALELAEIKNSIYNIK